MPKRSLIHSWGGQRAAARQRGAGRALPGADLIGQGGIQLLIQGGLCARVQFYHGKPFLLEMCIRDSHKLEAMFKAFAKALDAATRRDARMDGVLSTKGTL